jgi:hypothetical protein
MWFLDADSIKANSKLVLKNKPFAAFCLSVTHLTVRVGALKFHDFWKAAS